jgi:RNA polymerase sigma-70 factor (ECF subfamily)
MKGETRLVDEAQVREFLVTTYPRLVAAVALMEDSRATAEDAVQEALARAWERSGRGAEPLDNLSAWVTRVAMNLSKSRLRRLRAEARAKERVSSSLAPADSPEDRIDIQRSLARLPRRQRQATVLRYYLGMDVAEVAVALGVSEGTAKTALFRGRRALAVLLGEAEQEDEHEPIR